MKKNSIYPKLIGIGKEKVKFGKKYDRHFHSWWEVIYILDGENYFLVDKKEIFLKYGELLIIRPYVLHESSALRNGYSLYCLFIDYPSWKIFKKKEKFLLFNIENKVILELLLSQLNKCFTLSTPFSIINKYLELFISLIELEKLIFPVKKNKLHKSDITDKIIKIIEEKYSEQLSLKKISSYIDLSPSRVSHIFKENMGTSIINYLIKYRINRAKYLLLSSTHPIKEISSMVGFKNLNYFYLQFKKIVGMTPKSYKKFFSL